MVDDYTLDNVLDKIEKIDTEKLDDIKILIDTDDELPLDIVQNPCKFCRFFLYDFLGSKCPNKLHLHATNDIKTQNSIIL